MAATALTAALTGAALNLIASLQSIAGFPIVVLQRTGDDPALFWNAAAQSLCAATGENCDRLLDILWGLLPEGEPMFDPELLTIHPERFLVTERIREKILELTTDELPFSTAVVLERWEEVEGEILRIYASILVERPGQKGIVVGKQGAMIKAIGTAARLDLEEYLERRIYLELNVRLEPDWREDQALLAQIDRDVDLEIG